MLRACLNWKVIAALALVGLGVWTLAPNLLVGALPILLLAVCPLSMMFMMRSMQGDQHATSPEGRDGISRNEATRQKRLADLKSQLEETRDRQEAVAREIAKLEAPFEDEPLQAP
ncbi:MAG: DUF2933 domain-containing protein [Actinomycetota bacterium]